MLGYGEVLDACQRYAYGLEEHLARERQPSSDQGWTNARLDDVEGFRPPFNDAFGFALSNQRSQLREGGFAMQQLLVLFDHIENRRAYVFPRRTLALRQQLLEGEIFLVLLLRTLVVFVELLEKLERCELVLRSPGWESLTSLNRPAN